LIAPVRWLHRLAWYLRNERGEILQKIARMPRTLLLCIQHEVKMLVRKRKLWSQVKRSVISAAGGRPICNVILVEALGDIVATEPVSRHLAPPTEPAPFVVWFVRNRYRELLESNPNVNMVVDVECISEARRLVKFIGIGRLVDLHPAGSFCPYCLSPAPRSDDSNGVSVDNYYDIGSLLAAFSTAGGVGPLDEAPKVYIDEAVRTKVDSLKLPDDFIVFHCKSNADCRDWTVENWRDLAERVKTTSGCTVVEVGLSPFLRPTTETVNLCGKLSMLETAEVIRRSRLFVGVDSGPAHLADAVGARGVLLLGKYRHFSNHMPYSGSFSDSETAIILRHPDGTGAISKDAAFDAVNTQLSRVDPAHVTAS